MQKKVETNGKQKCLKFLSNQMRNYSDEKLIEIYRKNNGSRRRKAFDCLYLRYLEALRQYFYFAFHYDYEKAKDFVQDTFIKILEAPNKFDTNQKFKPWIYRVASNMCKNEYRKQKVIDKHNEEFKHTNSYFVELTENEFKLKESIKKLPQDKRSLIVLRFKINLSIKEIAEIYECPEGTIKSRLFYTTKELAKYLKQ